MTGNHGFHAAGAPPEGGVGPACRWRRPASRDRRPRHRRHAPRTRGARRHRAEVADQRSVAPPDWIARRSRVLPARDFEAALEQQARQRGAIGWTHPAARHLRAGPHGIDGRCATLTAAGLRDRTHRRRRPDVDAVVSGVGTAPDRSSRPSMTASAGSTRMFQMRTSPLRQLRAGRGKEPLHRAWIARRDLQRSLAGELAQPSVAVRRHLAEVGHRVELDVGFRQAVQHGRLDLRRHDLRVRAVAVENSRAPDRSWRRHPVRRLRPARPEVLAVLDRRGDAASRGAICSSPAMAVAFSCSGSPSARRLRINSPSVSSSASRWGDSDLPSVRTRFSTARSLPVSGRASS